ncbi:MAG: hypothetical protein ACERKD_00360 [Prolixibacteraceae bacterium]
MSNKCPNYEKCPIYNGILKGKTLTSKAYIHFFCDSENHITCKRYLVHKATGVCPGNILPNSVLTVEEIIAEYKLQKV